MNAASPGRMAEQARALAHQAHWAQVDKAGRPYIEHVSRVAALVADDPDAEAVAWLHDVLEDCPGYAAEVRLFPAYIVEAVVALTRMPGDTPERYYQGVRANPLALRVKLADLTDNASETRLAMLDMQTAERLRRKYAAARKALEH